MTNDGWGKEWPKITDTWVNSKVWENGVNKAFDEEFPSKLEQEWPKYTPIVPKPEWLNDVTDIKFVGIDLGSGDKTILTTFKDGQIKHEIIPPERLYNNKMPTHDPYTNPNAQIYYQCHCGAILDPGTKSFAALNNAAMNAGWKVRWGETSYKPYCVKCGEEVE